MKRGNRENVSESTTERGARIYLQTYRTIVPLNKQPSTSITTSMPQKPPASLEGTIRDVVHFK